MKTLLTLLLLAAPLWPQFTSSNAKRIQGKNVVAPLTCSDGEVLTWVDANNRFECAAGGGGGGGAPNASNTFSAGATTVTVTDNMGTTAKVVNCYIGTAPDYVLLVPNTVQLNSNTVVIGFDAASGDGKCVVNGTGAVAAFSGLTGGTNTAAAMVVGSGASLRTAAGIFGVPASTTLPATCTVGDAYMDTDATSGARWYLCESTDTWAAQGGGGSMVYPGAGVPISTGSAWATSITNSSTVGQTLRVTGASTYAFGALDLADADAITGTLPVGNGGTGITSLGTGIATWLGTPSSANLRSALTDESGTGAALFAGGNIGAASGTSLALTGALTAASVSAGSSPPAIDGGTSGKQAMGEGTAPTSGCPAAGVGCFYADSTAHRILLSNNNAAASAIAVQADKLSVFAATTSAELAGVLSDESGSSGGFVRAGSPALTTPDLGTPSAVNLTNATALPNSALTASIKSSGFGASFDGGGSAIATNSTAYMTIAAACTIAASNILVDTGTLTFKVWRVAAGTAIPTSGNSINTSGIAISTGTALRTTTVTDYTDTTLDANDILAITLTAVSGATKANIFVECNR